jgi:hypothetical protein
VSTVERLEHHRCTATTCSGRTTGLFHCRRAFGVGKTAGLPASESDGWFHSQTRRTKLQLFPMLRRDVLWNIVFQS